MNGNESRIEEMTAELTEAVGAEAARICAETAARLGYRKERYSIWIKDQTFISNVKSRYICAACGHWNVVKFRNAEIMLHHMRYCNGCGSKIVSVKETL